jgi:hypothetical protein
MTVRSTVKEQAEVLKNGAKYQAVKTHAKKNKKFYMGVGTGVLITLIVRKPTVQVSTTIQLASQ